MPAPIVQRHYETVVLIRPDASETLQNDVRERLQNIIESDGRIARWETWGKRKLAYEVQKQNKAWYLYSSFVTTQPNVAEMERNLRLMESVMLFQTIRLSDAVELDTFDFDAEAKERTPLFMTPEEAAAKELSYQREQEWAAGSNRDDRSAPAEEAAAEAAPAEEAAAEAAPAEEATAETTDETAEAAAEAEGEES